MSGEKGEVEEGGREGGREGETKVEKGEKERMKCVLAVYKEQREEDVCLFLFLFLQEVMVLP